MRIAVAGGTGTVGRHVVDVATEHGHETVVLSRSRGVDLVTGTGLEAALGDVDAVVDVASDRSRSTRACREFFGTTSTNLLAAEQLAGVGHHVALSIVGIEAAPVGYYAGKVRQEAVVTAGAVPWTILRATQFHEFARQVFETLRAGPLHLAPVMRSQPVAAREVAERLVELAVKGPSGRVPDLAGPEVQRMTDMVRAYGRACGHRGPVLPVRVPGVFGRAMRNGSLTAGPGADLGSQTFTQWIAHLPIPVR
ncbi:SDR family oxidoreductase [Kineococcus sp. SYSU DK003]|uniref:SDR family oxidoreductase n=1 Tax=Kineococcus sp. SYSU DK003 TaxID=3383124 RepID=UPI003D7D04B8